MNKKGITLVALVVTIIILLILATVTIGLILGNDSIFGRATEGRVKTEMAQLGERLNSAGASVLMDYQIGDCNIPVLGTGTPEVTEDDQITYIEGKLDLSATDSGLVTAGTRNYVDADKQYQLTIKSSEGDYWLHYLLDFTNNKSNFRVTNTATFPTDL